MKKGDSGMPDPKEKRRSLFNIVGRRSSSSQMAVDDAAVTDRSSLTTSSESEPPMRRRSTTINSSADLSKLPPGRDSGSSPTATKGSPLARQKSLSRLQNAITPKKRLSSGSLEMDAAALSDLQAGAAANRTGGLSSSLGTMPSSGAAALGTVAAMMGAAGAAGDAATQITTGTAKELVEMLVAPSVSGSRYRDEFFLAMNYVIDSNALLERVWAGIEAANKLSDKWMSVLKFWVTEHFYYFRSSQVLMTNLLQKVKTAKFDVKKLHDLIEKTTETQIVAKSNFRTPLDMQLLKTLLGNVLDKSYNDVCIPHVRAIEILSKSSVLLVSLNSDESERSEYFLRNASEKVLKRLVESGFLAVSVDNGEQQYALTSSGIAIFHQLTVEKAKSENLASLKTLVTTIVKEVGLKPRSLVEGDTTQIACVSGREIVDWMVKNNERIPREVRRVEVLDEKSALAVGKMMLDCNLLVDNTSGAFMMFSSTHLYTLPLRLNLSALAMPTEGAESEQALSPKSSQSSQTLRGDERVESLCDFEAAVIAKALTAIDIELMKNVDPTEMDFTGWKKGSGQTIQNWIAFFNRVSYLIATEIVTCPWPEERKLLLERFVDLGSLLLERRNFQALFAVVGGLTLNCVSRLVDLWEKGLDSKRQLCFALLQQVTSSRNNFKEYRALLAREEPDTVPYIGLLLQDILSIEEIPIYVAQDRKIESSDGTKVEMLNFERLRKLGMNKSVLLRAQKGAVAEDPQSAHLCEYLSTSGIALDRDTLYTLSLKIQTRSNRVKKTRK